MADAETAKHKGWTQKQFVITFWCPPPATDHGLAWRRLPNPAETRFLAFTTMAYGARGISYFL